MNKTLVWSGRTVSALAVSFLLFDAIIKILGIAPVVQSFSRLGYDPRVALTIGVLELVCIALYLVPRTSLGGAVLFTGFLGGAVATHLRVGDPLFTHVLFPTYIAALLWLGLICRDERVRALVAVKEY